MVTLLGFLLFFSVGGLGLLGYHAFQLHIRVAKHEAELAGRQTQYEDDVRQRNEHAANLKANLQGVVNKYNEDLKRWNDRIAALNAEIARLAKWKNVADADVRASEMLEAAQSTLAQAKSEAQSLVATAQRTADELRTEAEQQATAALADAEQRTTAQWTEAEQARKAMLAEARERASDLKEDAQAVLNSATSRAAAIVDSANAKAEQIAGNAYDALKNSALYEKTVRAMKNIIEGYGDRYLIPQQSLLDDLAEDFSHKRAGQELKRAREATAVMISNRTAALCNYAEANRRDTAINFAIDAFNGRVDSILSRVKHDNAGKLEEQIRNAFTLVNFNGKAFREARITEEFLVARLDELKWAAIAQQLALEEREEQRRIKEQMREESRAAKERARAERESAKEAEMLRKAEEQAREQFERASDEQKAMFELRLQEITAKLKEAEERGQRARSMAELTKKGYVYVISNVGAFGEDVFKIGLTRRWDPLERVRELGDSSVPFSFDVHATILSDDAPALELRLHEHFRLRQVNKVNHRKEFFRVSLQDVREEIEKLGVTTGVHWTMTAEAKEFRESQAIEKRIQDNPAEREAWLRRQSRLEQITVSTDGEDGDEDD